MKKSTGQMGRRIAEAGALVLAAVAWTSGGGWHSAWNPDPVHQAYLDWSNPDYTQSHTYTGPGPDWFLGAEKTGGDWTTDGWLSLNSTNSPALLIHLDRSSLTNNLAFVQLAGGDATGDLRADLLDEYGDPLALDLLGNLLDLEDPVHIPLAQDPDAVTLRLRHAAGEVLVQATRLYLDDDLDGLDAWQEAVLGTSDQNPDSDGDGYTDLYEFLVGTDPLDPNSQPAGALTLFAPPDLVLEYGQPTDPAATGQAEAYQNDGKTVTLSHSDTVVDTATGLPPRASPLWPWLYEMTLAPNGQNLDNAGGNDWWTTAAPPVSGGVAHGGAGLLFRSDFNGSIWRLGIGNENYTVEFAANILTAGAEGSMGSLGFFGEKPGDAHQGLRFNIKRQGQTVSNGSTVTRALGADDNTDGFHAFRIARVAPGRYELWRNGRRLNSAPVVGANNGSDDAGFLGAFSASFAGGWQVDWMRLTPGAYAPDAPVSRTILRTWTAVGTTGSTNAVQRIVIRDTTPPVLTLPPDVTQSFDASTAPTNTGYATAWDLYDPAPVVTHRDRDYRTSLEALLTLEESDGYFRSLAGVNRAFQGSAVSVPGRIGSAAELDGAHALVSSANALPGVSAVSLWFRTTASAQAMLYSVEGAIFAYIQNGHLQPVFDGSSSGDPWWGSGLNNGQWHHLLAQNDGTNTVLYVDGTLLGSRAETPANLANWNRTSALGGQYDGQSLRFAGALDDVAFYSRTLSAAEIAALAGGSETVVLERTWTATDASGNSASAVQTLGRTGAQDDDDQDGLSNRDEEILGTDSKNPDTNSNGMGDGIEFRGGGNAAKPGDPLFPFVMAAALKLPAVQATFTGNETFYYGTSVSEPSVYLNGDAGGAWGPDRIVDAGGHLSGTETYVTLWRPEPGILEIIFDGYGPTDGEPVTITGGLALKHGRFIGDPYMRSGECATGSVTRVVGSATNITWSIVCQPYPNYPPEAPNRGWARWRIRYEPDVVAVDIDADTDRNGEINEEDENGEDNWNLERGTLITPPLWGEDSAAETNDVSRLSKIRITCHIPGGFDTGSIQLKILKKKVPNDCDLHVYTTDGHPYPAQESILLPWPTNELFLAVSPQYARPRPPATVVPALTYILEVQAVKGDGQVVATDTIQLRVAPLILPPECNNATAIYSPSISQITGIAYVAATNAGPWGQDMVKFMKYQTFRTGIRDVFADLEHEQKGDYPKMLREAAHRDGGRIWKAELGGDGGSVMASPPFGTNTYGAIFIGSQSEVFRDHWRMQGVQPVFPVDTSWLLVGHVDEVIMFVSTNKMLYASPRLAADLLHREIMEGREQKIMWWGTGTNDTVATRSNSIARVVIATAPNGSHKLTELPTGGMPATTNATDIVFGSPLFEEGDILRADDEFLRVTVVNGSTVTVARAIGGSAPAAHEAGIRIYALSNAMKTNLPFNQNNALENISSVTNTVRAALAGSQMEFIPVPVLFGWATRQFEDGTMKSGFIAATPNLANCLVVNQSRVIFPTPGIDVFQNDVTNKVPGAEFHDLWEWHIREGSVHCAVSVIRELPGEPPWWERITEWE